MATKQCFIENFSQIIFQSIGYILETINELVYTPKSERDYGTLACYGKNTIGKQSEPCLFQVVPAGLCFNKFPPNLIFTYRTILLQQNQLHYATVL